MVVRLFPIVTAVREVQDSNAQNSRVVTLSGMTRDVREVQE